jgi:hypothetical protein
MICSDISHIFLTPVAVVANGQPRTMSGKQYFDNQFEQRPWGPSALRAAARLKEDIQSFKP